MKQRLIYVCLISLMSFSYAQVNVAPQPIPYKIFVGIDLANPGFQFLSDKKGYEGTISVPVYKKIHAVVEAGYEENKFNQTDWDADINGFFGRVGVNWYIGADHKNLNNGYYLGARAGYSPYTVNVKTYPIRNAAGELIAGSLGEMNSNAMWLAPIVGARVNLGDTNIYVDANAQLNFLIFDTNPEDIETLAVPGFGVSNNKLNLRVLWSIGYAF